MAGRFRFQLTLDARKAVSGRRILFDVDSSPGKNLPQVLPARSRPPNVMPTKIGVDDLFAAGMFADPLVSDSFGNEEFEPTPQPGMRAGEV